MLVFAAFVLMPSPVWPEIRLRWAGRAPPIRELGDVLNMLMPVLLGAAAVPAGLIPRKHPSTTSEPAPLRLIAVPKFVIAIPRMVVLPALTLNAILFPGPLS